MLLNARGRFTTWATLLQPRRLRRIRHSSFFVPVVMQIIPVAHSLDLFLILAALLSTWPLPPSVGCDLFLPPHLRWRFSYYRHSLPHALFFVDCVRYMLLAWSTGSCILVLGTLL